MCDASGKEPACQSRRHKTRGFRGQEDPLKEGMEAHSSILAWRIPEEPGGLPSIGPQRVRQDCSDLAHIEHIRHPQSQDSFLKCVKENEGKK